MYRPEIGQGTDLVRDLHDHPVDVAEFVRLVEGEFGIRFTEEAYGGLTRLDQFAGYILREQLTS